MAPWQPSTPPKTNMSPENWWLEDVFWRCISYWNSPFLEDMLVFPGVCGTRLVAQRTPWIQNPEGSSYNVDGFQNPANHQGWWENPIIHRVSAPFQVVVWISSINSMARPDFLYKSPQKLGELPSHRHIVANDPVDDFGFFDCCLLGSGCWNRPIASMYGMGYIPSCISCLFALLP